MKRSRLLFAFGLFLICSLAFASCTPTANYEISVHVNMSELINNRARNRKDADFLKVYYAAHKACNGKKVEFIETFFKKSDKLFPNKKYASYFKANSVIRINSTNKVVKDYFKAKQESVAKKTIESLSARLDILGVAYCEFLPGTDWVKVGVNKTGDRSMIAHHISKTARLEFLETFSIGEVQPLISKMIVAEDARIRMDYENKDTNIVETLAMIEETQRNMVFEKMRLDEYYLTVHYRDVSAVKAFLERKDIKKVLPKNLYFKWSAQLGEDENENRFILYACKIPRKKGIRLTNRDVNEVEAYKSDETNQYVVNITMTNNGARKWEKLTRANVGKTIAISMRDVVYSAPNVNAAIKGGETEISGSFTEEEAKELASLIGAGDLPVHCIFDKIRKL